MANIEPLITFIKSFDDWENKLSEHPFYLKIKQHPEIKSLYMFSYNMIKSDFTKEIVQVSRGLVLNIVDTKIRDQEGFPTRREVSVFARAFDKFFNYGESLAVNLDFFRPVYAREKLDGSLIKYRNSNINGNGLDLNQFSDYWMTNNSFDTGVLLNNDSDFLGEYNTFQDLIDEALKGHNLSKLRMAGQVVCLYFELTSFWNRVVVKYDYKPKLWLLGARDIKTQQEISPEQIKKEFDLDFDIPMRYGNDKSSLFDIIEIVSKFDNTHEGIVLQDSNFDRVKIKSEQYVMAHKLKDSDGQLSYEHLLKSIQDGTIDDILGLFPEFSKKINEIMDNYRFIGESLDAVYKSAKIFLVSLDDNIEEKERKKRFALQYKDSPYSSVYFDIYKGTDFETIKSTFLKKLDYKKLCELGAIYEN